MIETPARIRWAESIDTAPGYGTFPAWRGHVGSCAPYLFLITKRSLDGDEFALCTELPWARKKRSYGDPDTLKAEAERWLEEFVTSLGAVFPVSIRNKELFVPFADEDDDEDGEPLEVKYAAGRRVRYAHADAGYPGEKEHAAASLALGEVYTIGWADIGQSRTDLNLYRERRSVGRFNSVFFELADDPAPRPRTEEG